VVSPPKPIKSGMPDWMFFILLGGPGLLVGLIVGAALPRAKFFVPLLVVGAVPTWLTFTHAGAAVLAAFAVYNYAGWAVGLTTGATVHRAMRRRSA
jgi:hypothetical protein